MAVFVLRAEPAGPEVSEVERVALAISWVDSDVGEAIGGRMGRGAGDVINDDRDRRCSRRCW